MYGESLPKECWHGVGDTIRGNEEGGRLLVGPEGHILEAGAWKPLAKVRGERTCLGSQKPESPQVVRSGRKNWRSVDGGMWLEGSGRGGVKLRWWLGRGKDALSGDACGHVGWAMIDPNQGRRGQSNDPGLMPPASTSTSTSQQPTTSTGPPGLVIGGDYCNV